MNKSVRLLQKNFQENLEYMLKNLLADESFSDITIHCKDGAVKAHKIVLAAFSPYFKKIFQKHPEHQVAFLVHGIGIRQLESLIELIYKGTTEVPGEMSEKLCNIAEEFGLKGIVDDECCLNFEKEMVNSYCNKHKKTAVLDLENLSDSNNFSKDLNKSSLEIEEPSRDLADLKYLEIKQESQEINFSTILPTQTPLTAEARRKSNWALKQRKYKCSLCTASFKRASHLNRHQLVHTGERPYACNQCDKAFSRHDKLKHHIRKTHTAEFVGNLVETSTENNLFAYNRNADNGTTKLDILAEEPLRITRKDLLARMTINLKNDENILGKDDEIVTSPETETSSADFKWIGQKKTRGRPRKYPLLPKSLIKRPRGRPRLCPKDELSGDNYDITNMPFGDFEYLTKSIHAEENSDTYEEQSNSIESNNIMEPLVEIELEQNNSTKISIIEECDKSEQVLVDSLSNRSSTDNFLKNIGLLDNSSVRKMEIGECTLSVSNLS